VNLAGIEHYAFLTQPRDALNHHNPVAIFAEAEQLAGPIVDGVKRSIEYPTMSRFEIR
jgi:hypothetical protein